MFFKSILLEKIGNEPTIIFVDMDGVVVFYDVGNLKRFDLKRPLISNIEILEEISKIDNIELHILSISPTNHQIDEKNDWLNIYMPFVKSENRHIISKEANMEKSSREMKCDFLTNYETNKKIALLDDDNQVLNFIYRKLPNIILFQDSVLID